LETNQNTPLDCTTASLYDLKNAYYNGRPISEVKLIATHYGAHNDEIHGGYLLKRTKQGKYLFPGIEEAAFGCLSTTHLRKKYYLGKQGFFKALQKGVLLLGVGGGPLDEHGDRNNRISCTELIVRRLDLRKEKDDRKLYGRLIEYVNFEDGNGDNAIQALNRIREAEKEAGKNEINALIANMEMAFNIKFEKLAQEEKIFDMIFDFYNKNQRLYKEESDTLLLLQIGALAQNLKKGFENAGSDYDEQQKIFDMAFQFYENEIGQAKLFIKAELAYIATAKHVIPLVTPNKEGSFVLLEMQSDVAVMNKVVHNKWRKRPDKNLGILFLHKSNGQFVLMPNSQYFYTVDMAEIVKILRQMVARKFGLPAPIPMQELTSFGVHDLVPEIHFDESTGVISNGSKVDPDVDGLIGSILSVEEIIEAIQIALDTDYFPKDFADGCASGKCATRKCPLYHFGLARCIAVREMNPAFKALKSVLVSN